MKISLNDEKDKSPVSRPCIRSERLLAAGQSVQARELQGQAGRRQSFLSTIFSPVRPDQNRRPFSGSLDPSHSVGPSRQQGR